jgi:hypothetical protein
LRRKRDTNGRLGGSFVNRAERDAGRLDTSGLDRVGNGYGERGSDIGRRRRDRDPERRRDPRRWHDPAHESANLEPERNRGHRCLIVAVQSDVGSDQVRR